MEASSGTRTAASIENKGLTVSAEIVSNKKKGLTVTMDVHIIKNEYLSSKLLRGDYENL